MCQLTKHNCSYTNDPEVDLHLFCSTKDHEGHASVEVGEAYTHTHTHAHTHTHTHTHRRITLFMPVINRLDRCESLI